MATPNDIGSMAVFLLQMNQALLLDKRLKFQVVLSKTVLKVRMP
jgi:hypothetical protein